MLEPFVGVAAHIHTVPIGSHASFAPGDLKDVATGLSFPADAYDDVENALSAIPLDARVLIFGSLYLAGEILAANDQVPD
jgi:dihydrofolate synthase/folylpolyglutamate synthase